MGENLTRYNDGLVLLFKVFLDLRKVKFIWNTSPRRGIPSLA